MIGVPGQVPETSMATQKPTLARGCMSTRAQE
jgi:hypothetical protein